MANAVADNIGEARENVVGWWNRSRTFLTEVRNELKRVTWPSQKEVYATTIMVIVTSAFFGLFLWSVSERNDRRQPEAVVHRPYLLGVREEGRRVAGPARGRVRTAGRDRRD